jgi:hypothetical protein
MKYLKHIITLFAYICISINVLADFLFHSEPISEVINLVQTFETETSQEIVLNNIDIHFASYPNFKEKLKNLIHDIFAHTDHHSEWFPLFKNKFPELFTVFDLTEAFEPEAIFPPNMDFQVYQETYFNDDPIISIQNKSSVYQAWNQRMNSQGKPQVFIDLTQNPTSILKLDKDTQQKIIDSALNFVTPELEVPFEAIKKYIESYKKAFKNQDFQEYLKRRSDLISKFKRSKIDLSTQISLGLQKFHQLTEGSEPLTYSRFYKVFVLWSAIVDYSSTPWITETFAFLKLPYDIVSYERKLVRKIIDMNLTHGFFFMPSLLPLVEKDFIGTLSTPIDNFDILIGNRRFDRSRNNIFTYHFHDTSHTDDIIRSYQGVTQNDDQYFIDIQELYKNRALHESHFTQALVTFLQICKDNLSQEDFELTHKVLTLAHREKYIFCLSPIEKNFMSHIFEGLKDKMDILRLNDLFNFKFDYIEKRLKELQPLWEQAWETLPLGVEN